MKKKFSLAILVVMSLVLIFSGCGGTAPQKPTSTTNGGPPYLRLAASEPVTLDPHLVTDIGSHGYVGKLYSGLLRLDLAAVDKNNDGDFTDRGEIIGSYTKDDIEKILTEALPINLAFTHEFELGGKTMRGLYHVAADLAKEIPDPVYNSDGTVSYTIKLKDKVIFRSGREVTAWDIAYSFDRAADPETMSSTAELYLGDILGVWEMLYGRDYQGEKLFNRVYFGYKELHERVYALKVEMAPINNEIKKLTEGEEPTAEEKSRLDQLRAEQEALQAKLEAAEEAAKVENWIPNAIVDLPGVEVIDAKTLKVTTKDVLPNLFYFHLTYPTAAVVDKVQVDAAPRSWTDNPNVTGPYWLEKKSVGQIILRANKSYHGLPPRIDKIVYDISGGSTLSSYENDEIDLSGVGVADIQAVRDPQSEFAGEYFESVEMSTSYIGLNTKEPPFDDVKVRQAFAMSVDKEWLAREVLVDLVIPAKGVLPPGMPGHRPGLQGLPFDPQKARELLSQSKYGGPEGLPRIRLTISGTGSAPSVVLQGIVEMWKTNLGVEVILESIDYVTFLDHIKKGQFQMFSLGWIADYPDPEDFLDLKFHSKRSRANNETGYFNEQFDALIEAARSERDPQKRLQLYQQAEDIIIEEVPWLLLFHSKKAGLVKSYIHDFFPTPMGISAVRYMYFE